jgi:hypothetical protein
MNFKKLANYSKNENLVELSYWPTERNIPPFVFILFVISLFFQGFRREDE